MDIIIPKDVLASTSTLYIEFPHDF